MPDKEGKGPKDEGSFQTVIRRIWLPALIFAIIIDVALISCDTNTQKGSGTGSDTGQGMMSGGTAWGTGAFRSNGERIYFTATSERGTSITYAGAPSSSGWMMMGGGNWHAFRATARMGEAASTTWA